MIKVVSLDCFVGIGYYTVLLFVRERFLKKKYFFFWSLPELSLPPSFQATSTSISDVKNYVLRVCQKNINYDNDGCKYNYDGNFDDNDDKKLPDNNIKDFG